MAKITMEDLPELIKDVPAEYREQVVEKSIKMIAHPAFGQP